MQQECKPTTCLATCKTPPSMQKRLVTKVTWLPVTFVPYSARDVGDIAGQKRYLLKALRKIQQSAVVLRMTKWL